MDDTELVAAVRRGDADAVRTLVEAGAAPDTLTADGLPVLCLAVAAHDAAVADELVEGGADPDRVLPDGTTPLVRAIDAGSPAVVTAVLGREPRLRLPEAERERLLTLARHRHEQGAEDELRRRTRAFGPVHEAQVMDGEYDHVTQLTLGGCTVRAGHSAILTNLEWAFRVLTPVDELVDRAMAQPDPEHVAWSSARWILSQRDSRQTWSAVTAHRHSTDPARRLFVLAVLFAYLLWAERGRNSHDKETAELLVAWADEGEENPEVLAQVLWVLSETDHQETEALGLRYAGHPDPGVRSRVPDLLLAWNDRPSFGTAARAVLLAQARDEHWSVRVQAGVALVAAFDGSTEVTDAVVGLLRDPSAPARAGVAQAVANSAGRAPVVVDGVDRATVVVADMDRAPAVGDALAALLDDDDFMTRLDAAYGLLRRGDPRTASAVERAGDFSRPGFEHDHRLSALWSWQRERDHPPASTDR